MLEYLLGRRVDRGGGGGWGVSKARLACVHWLDCEGLYTINGWPGAGCVDWLEISGSANKSWGGVRCREEGVGDSCVVAEMKSEERKQQQNNIMGKKKSSAVPLDLLEWCLNPKALWRCRDVIGRSRPLWSAQIVCSGLILVNCVLMCHTGGK